MKDIKELGPLMLELLDETDGAGGMEEAPIVFTDRAKEIIREISAFAQRTRFYETNRDRAKACYSGDETPEQIYCYMLMLVDDAPTSIHTAAAVIG